MGDIRKLQDQIKPSSTNDGDAISALVIAIQMIDAQCTSKAGKPLAYKRRIILVTNGRGRMDPDQLDQITSKIKQDSTELVILGVDFDDAGYGFKEEDKHAEKMENEELLRNLAEDCNGMFGTLAEAIDQMEIPRLKTTRPVHSYKGYLTLGDPEQYDSALRIDVERYPRTAIAKPPTASQFVVRADLAPGEANTQSTATLAEDTDQSGIQHSLAAVKNTRTYQVTDENAPGGKKDVDADDLARGFEYGRTAVHISESESNVTKLETRPSLDIVGFVPRDKCGRYLAMSKSNIIIAQKTNDKASLALSSLIHALYEVDSYAIARLVTKEGKEPVLLLLAPFIEPDYEYLIDVELPFAEDIRGYKFAPLDKVVTVSGKNLIQHRNLPSDDLMQAMSDYVDAMDLSTFGKDDEGNPAEYMPIDETYSPLLHRVNQILRWRAVNPTADGLPPPPALFLKYSKPPEELVHQAQPCLDAVKSAGDVKKVPPKQKGHKRAREYEKPLSGLDVEELLGHEKRTKISPENAIPEFKQVLATTEDLQTIKFAMKQMVEIVYSNIKNSLGDSGYGRAIEAIRIMREEMTELEEPEIFNNFVRELKKDILGGKLNGERRDMWWKIRANRLGLIDKSLSPLSEVGEEEAKEFLKSTSTG